MKKEKTSRQEVGNHRDPGSTRIVLISSKASIWSLSISRLMLGVVFFGVVCALVSISYAGYLQGRKTASGLIDQVVHLQSLLDIQQTELDQVRLHVQYRSEASAKKISQLQTRLVRLDALGERLTRVASLDEGEFRFGDLPALGGPASLPGEAYAGLEVGQLIEQLATRIETTQQQLRVMETLLADREISKSIYIAGQPSRTGWISSPYGPRIDPINGKPSMHNGIDFAALESSEVVAVASGVVTFSGTRRGYGKVVEIDHGGGYTTLYGHQKALAVATGDVVKKGEAVGYVGSTGRSNGPSYTL